MHFSPFTRRFHVLDIITSQTDSHAIEIGKKKTDPSLHPWTSHHAHSSSNFSAKYAHLSIKWSNLSVSSFYSSRSRRTFSKSLPAADISDVMSFKRSSARSMFPSISSHSLLSA